MVLIAGRQAVLDVGLVSKPAHGDCIGAGMGAELFDQFPSVDIGQADIAENDIKLPEIITVQCCLSVRDYRDLMAGPFQKQRDELSGDLVIFYQQNP